MKNLMRKSPPFTSECPLLNTTKPEPSDHTDCPECDWQASCERCGCFNDGEDTMCMQCELDRAIMKADMLCDEAMGK